jgi:hypothetical protein
VKFTDRSLRELDGLLHGLPRGPRPLGDIDLEDLVAQIAARRFRGKLVFISGAEDYLALAQLHCDRAGLRCRGLHKPFGTEELQAVLNEAPDNAPDSD